MSTHELPEGADPSGEPAAVQPDPDEPTWERLDALAHEADAGPVAEFVDGLTSAELAQALAHLDGDERTAVLSSMLVGPASELIERIPQAQAAQILEQLQPQHAASILEELPASEQADLVAELDEDDADSILEAMPPTAARSLQRLSRYDETSAGGLMDTEFFHTSAGSTIKEVRDLLHSEAEQERRLDVQYIYVLAEGSRLVGVLPIRDLIFARRSQQVTERMLADPTTVSDTAPLEELVEHFRRHRYLALPVVSKRGRMLGAVTRAAVEHAQADQRETDHLRSQGIVREELRSMPFFRRASRRLTWLSSNILLNFLAASVIAFHQDTLQAAIALAVFLPIISDMSGCSGNQAVAVSMRELSLGVVGPRDTLFVWLKEITVGLMNGTALGCLLGGAAWLWQGNAWLGLVVGVALALNTLVAVSLGGCLPLILRRLRIDPAVASGPLLTTVTDLCGFFLVLSIASSMLERIS